MAIDNIIAAGIQPATPLMSPMQTMGGLMQLRGQMADQSLREAQMVEIRQRQQNEKLRGDQINLELKDANNFAEIQKDPSLMRQFAETGDVSMFHQKGISPAFIEKLAEGRDKRITGMQTQTVTGQGIKKTATEQMIATGDGIMAPMADGTPVDVATANSRYQGALPRLKELALQRGDDPQKLPGSIASLEQIRGVLSGLNLDAGLYAAATKRTEETAKRDEAVAKAAIESKKYVGTDAQGLTAKDRAEIAQHNADTANAKAKLPKNEADAAIAELEAKFRKEHNGLSANELKTAQLRQKEFDLKSGGVSLTPQQQSISDKLASGDLNPSQLARLQDKEAILAGAIAKGFNQSTYDTKQAFDNPRNKQSQNLGTISRIVGHIQRYEENSAKMGTDPIYGFGQNLTGLQKALTEDAQAMAAELEKLFSGGVGTQAQIKEWESSLRSSFAGVREKAINEISKLAGSQLESMNQTYKTGLGKDLPLEKYVNADGRKWLQKNGINVSGETEIAGPSEDVKDALKGASPGIHTLNDGSRWMVSRDGKVSAP
jgi:hypothetical protein